MASLDFLNDIAADYSAPPTLTRGRYRFVITGYDGGVMNNDKQSPYVDITAHAVEVLSGDVDPAKLNDHRSVRYRFWMSEKAKYILKNFFKDVLNLDIGESSSPKSFSQLLEDSVGQHFIGEVAVKVLNSGESAAEIKRVFPND